MRYVYLSLMAVLLTTIISCKQNPAKDEIPAFEKNTPDLSNGMYTPEILWSLGRMGDVHVSPDKRKVLLSITYYSINQNKGNSDLYIYDLTTNKLRQITNTPYSEYSAVWRPDGDKISFLCAKDGSMQVYEIDAHGKDLTQVTEEEGDISNFAYAITLDKMLYTKEVKVLKTTAEVYTDLPKANAYLIDDLMYRHWDAWEDENFSHVFVAEYNTRRGVISDGIDIMQGEAFDTPTKPNGGIEEIAISPDGKMIAYTCKKLSGKAYATSTNSEIYLYNTENKQTKNISEGFLGYDRAPVFSPDNKKIAWVSMERDGFESDKTRIMVYEIDSKVTTNYSEKFDQSAESLAWNEASNTLFFISGTKATEQLYKLTLTDKSIQQITVGDHNYVSFDLAGEYLVGARQSMLNPTDLIKVSIADGGQEQITKVNDDILSKIRSAKIEKRWIKSNDSAELLVWVVYPPDFDPNKKYPTLLYFQGGPQSAVSQFYSYRWNFQLMAANGYIIVAPNRRGLPSFGQAWNDQISKDYGGQNQKDMFSAIDAMSKEPYVDKDRLGAAGASYGGFAIFWMAGNHQKRFKAFVAHAGIFNFESMYGATEENFFVNWDMGGPYWNPEAKNSYSASPHLFVKNWDTPILIIHGSKDYRIPETQAMNAFAAAQLQNIPSRLIVFPEENHWILKPQNGILWQREFYGWFDKYLKK